MQRTCIVGWISEIRVTKSGKRPTINNNIAETIRVELKTTLIYLANVSRDSLNKKDLSFHKNLAEYS